MREAVTHHFLTTGDLIVFISFVEVGRQFVRFSVSIIVRHNGTFTWQPAVVTRIRIALEVAQESEIGFIIRTPAERRRNRVTSRFHHFLLRVLTTSQTGQTVGPHAVIVNRVAEIKPRLPEVIRPHFELNFFQRFRSWTLADHTHYAARMAFAIQYRRRATQQLYALKEVRVHGRFRVVVSLQLHTIQILVGIHGAGGRETTNRNHIVSC